MTRSLLFGVVFFLSLMVTETWAEVSNFPFETELEEKRFQSLLVELRCPKCQNQSLSDSDAPIAKDLRQKIYELIKDGKSDQEIRQYLVQRYGDFINYRPPVKSGTILLWLGPGMLLLISLGLAVFFVSRNHLVTEGRQSDQDE